MSDPQFCRPDAYRLLQAQLPILETTTGLVRGAVAIAAHGLEGANVEQVERELAELAQRVRSRVHGKSFDALLAHLHDVLFEEDGFHGNVDNYYLAANSYLPIVLHTRLGIPICLCLIYKAVAEHLGLIVEGINAPGHFLTRVRGPLGWQVIDPFHAGAVVDLQELRARLAPDPHLAAIPHEQLFPVATHREWLLRMLRNLEKLLGDEGRTNDHAAMVEMIRLLETSAR